MYFKVNDSLKIHGEKWEDNLYWLYFSPHFQHCYHYYQCAIVINQYLTLVYMFGNGNKSIRYTAKHYYEDTENINY